MLLVIAFPIKQTPPHILILVNYLKLRSPQPTLLSLKYPYLLVSQYTLMISSNLMASTHPSPLPMHQFCHLQLQSLLSHVKTHGSVRMEYPSLRKVLARFQFKLASDRPIQGKMQILNLQDVIKTILLLKEITDCWKPYLYPHSLSIICAHSGPSFPAWGKT